MREALSFLSGKERCDPTSMCKSTFLGDPRVHVESFYAFSARVSHILLTILNVLADATHVRLPGGHTMCAADDVGAVDGDGFPVFLHD